MSDKALLYDGSGRQVISGKSVGSGLVTGGNWHSISGGISSRYSQSVADAGPTDFTTQIYQFKSHVYECVTLIAQVCATAPLKLYVGEGDDKEEITDHRFLDVWREVNPILNRFDLIELIAMYLNMTGNAYLYLVLDGLGLPVEIYPLPSHRMKIIPGKEIYIGGYSFDRGRGKKITFKPEEIIHFKLPNPFDPLYYGLSPIWALAMDIDFQNGINRVERALMKNQARPDLGVILEEVQDMDDPNFKRGKQEFIDNFSDPDHQGKPLFIGGVKDIKNWNFPLRDFSFLKGRSNIRQNVYAGFKVPITFGSREGSPGRATMDSDLDRLILLACKPMLTRMQEKLNEGTVRKHDKVLHCEFDVESVRPKDNEHLLKIRAEDRKDMESNLKSGLTVPDEEREKKGMGPRPDGMGGKVMVSVNMVPADELQQVEGKSLDPPATEIEPETTIHGKSKKEKKVYSLGTDKIEKMTRTQVAGMRGKVKKVFKAMSEQAAGALHE
jgi:HK97 family phage portal protein